MSGLPDDLAVRYLEGAASADDVAALEKHLRADEQARRSFVRLSHLQALISELAREPLLSARPTPRWRVIAFTATAAAAAMLVIGVWRGFAIGARDTGPTVSGSSGEIAWTRNGRGLRLVDDARLAPGDRLALAGDAHLRIVWPDGALVAVDPDSDVAIGVDASRLRLDRGMVQAIITHDPARPFTIATADGLITDLGTVFVVRRGATRTRVEVAQGTVRLTTGGEHVDVPAGAHAVAIAGQAPRLLAPPPPQAVPSSAAGWNEPLPLHARMARLPDALAVATWRVRPALRLSLPTAGAAMRPVRHRGQPGALLGDAPVPDLRGLEYAIGGAHDLILVDAVSKQAWELSEPEGGAGGISARRMTPIAFDAVRALPGLGGLLTPRDLERGPPRDAQSPHTEHVPHALVVAVPAAVLGEHGLRIGDRICIVGAPTPGNGVAGSVLAEVLASHGARVVASEGAPTLFVDPRLSDEVRASLTAALAELAPALRRVETAIADDPDQ